MPAPLCTRCNTHHLPLTCPPKFIPVPDGMTLADAEAALADAGAWVEVDSFADMPEGARLRRCSIRGLNGQARRYVHRDDLPPTDPDAELVEAMARALYVATKATPAWGERNVMIHDLYRGDARAALAVVREHEAKS